MWARASKVDVVYRKILLTKFFTKGWGTVENLKRICEFGKVISDRSRCQHLVDNTYPIFIDKNEKSGECRVIEGHFLSPFAKYMKGVMPKEVETARFQLVIPLQWKSESKPVCIHLAGTGDHGFWRRRTIMARPLLKEYNIGSIILENPFYGLRKPKEQLRSSLLNVSDLFVMGGALILETLTLLHWCEKEGYGPLGISGVSMGGHMATLAATNWHKPICLIPCLSWSNATPIFTQGVLSGAIPWKTLGAEYVFHSEYEAEILRKLMRSPNYEAYTLGKDFVSNFPDSIEDLKDVNLESGMFHEAATRRESSAGGNSVPVTSTETAKTHSNLSNNTSTSHGSVPDQSDQTRIISGLNDPRTATSTVGESGRILSPEKTDGISESVINPASTQNKTTDPQKTSRTKEVKSARRGAKKWKPSKSEQVKLRQDALQFMEGVMDASTFVGNFSKPVDPELVLAILANHDAYIPWNRMPDLQEMWPGMEVRYINSGHVAAILFKQHHFRRAIFDTFQKMERKYPTLSPTKS